MFVKIKIWEQMEKEYGLKESGNIDCYLSFMKSMEHKMPKSRVIHLNNVKKWLSRYNISEDMIEEYMDKKYSIYGKQINLTKTV